LIWGGTSTVPTVASPAPTTFTTPNGAVIDASGNVITPAPQTAQDAQLQAQQAAQEQMEAILAPLDNEINKLQTQVNTCDGQISMPTSQGLAQAQAQSQAAGCQNLTSELSVFLAEQKVIQDGGIMTQTCSANILNLAQQIYNLRQKAAGVANTYGTTPGMSAPTAQVIAQYAVQAEAVQEAPLDQQVQQNLYYCQN
jgi:hypothetical protein